MPDNLSFEEAASLPFGGTTALHYLRKADLKAGQSILVIGASGAVGTAMVQLARSIGAQVSAVTSTSNIELVRSLGAGRVIDYTWEDFHSLPDCYDVIADTVGASSFARCLPKLNENGRYLSIAGNLSDMLARPSGSKKSISGPAMEKLDDVQRLAKLAEIGVLKAVIDKTFSFSDLPAAHAYVETGRKKGNVVVSVIEDE